MILRIIGQRKEYVQTLPTYYPTDLRSGYGIMPMLLG